MQLCSAQAVAAHRINLYTQSRAQSHWINNSTCTVPVILTPQKTTMIIHPIPKPDWYQSIRELFEIPAGSRRCGSVRLVVATSVQAATLLSRDRDLRCYSVALLPGYLHWNAPRLPVLAGQIRLSAADTAGRPHGIHYMTVNVELNCIYSIFPFLCSLT